MRLLLVPALSVLTGLFLSAAPPPAARRVADFIAEQKAHARVQAAYAEKTATIDSLLTAHGLQRDDLNVLLTVFKQERELEIWVKSFTARAYERLVVLPICQRSGGPGPKRARGDYQTPEGFYTLDRFNPTSAYYLSLGLDYPNAADRGRARPNANLGGDIFLHGECVTAGCVPLTNDGIKTLYVCALEARRSGQEQLPVYLFPARLTAEKLAGLQARYAAGKPALAAFWANLRIGYEQFNATHEALRVGVGEAGQYTFR